VGWVLYEMVKVREYYSVRSQRVLVEGQKILWEFGEKMWVMRSVHSY
jgi:hypothetical protein